MPTELQHTTAKPMRLRIEAPDGVAKKGRVLLDDLDISHHVTAVKVSAAVDEVTSAELTLIGVALDVDVGLLNAEGALKIIRENEPKPEQVKPISRDLILCPRCGHTMELRQYESTDTPHGFCPKCGAECVGSYTANDGFVVRLLGFPKDWEGAKS